MRNEVCSFSVVKVTALLNLKKDFSVIRSLNKTTFWVPVFHFNPTRCVRTRTGVLTIDMHQKAQWITFFFIEPIPKRIYNCPQTEIKLTCTRNAAKTPQRVPLCSCTRTVSTSDYVEYWEWWVGFFCVRLDVSIRS